MVPLEFEDLNQGEIESVSWHLKQPRSTHYVR